MFTDLKKWMAKKSAQKIESSYAELHKEMGHKHILKHAIIKVGDRYGPLSDKPHNVVYEEWQMGSWHLYYEECQIES